MSGHILSDQDLDTLFREARTYNGWQDKEVSDVLLHALYDLLKFGPTSANCCPMRVKFVKSPEAKKRLAPHLDAGNKAKTMAAPATAVIAYDFKFYEHLPRLFPHSKDAKSWFEGDTRKIEETANRNGTLQGAYLILAARALGLDCGPMSGFDAAAVKKEFFPDEDVQVNFLCNLGYGDKSSLFPRSPRFAFDDVCEIV
jgi:3-hydroxypropanoate dehydrogenase